MWKCLPWFIVGLLILGNSLVFYKIDQTLRASSIQKIAYNPPPSNNLFNPGNVYTTPQKAASKEVIAPPTKKISEFVPILMYHYIRDYTDQSDQLGIGLSVSPAVFTSQLEIIKKAGYNTITVQDYVNGRYGKKPIVLTFDDGYDDHYSSAYPILKSEGMVGSFYIISGFVNEPRYLTTAQITEMKAGGMEIGGHTVDHKNLATMSSTLAFNEIKNGQVSRDPVFAYPSGQYNATTVSLVKQLGIKAALTTALGVATDVSDFEQLPRIRVKTGTDILKVISDQEYLLLHPVPIPVAP